MRTIRSIFKKQIVLTAAFYLMVCLAGFARQPIDRKDSKSAFDPKSAEWKIEWPGRVSQYDLVYLSPPIDPMQGIPLGNGEVGVLFWCEDSKLIAVVNKSDLWDDAAFGPFHNWSGKEEDYSTTQRHACRIVIDFKLPVFSVLYLSDFKAKLNLAEATLTLEATSPFGKVGLTAFVDHKTGTLFYHLSSDLKENVPVDISVERFGSRTYSHWYAQTRRDPGIGLAGTETLVGENGAFLTQKLSSGTFGVGAGVIQKSGINVNYSREHSRSALIQLTGDRQKNAQLAFVVTSPMKENPVEGVNTSLEYARENGMEFFRKSHLDEWKSLWKRSYMDYGDDYLNNLWHLTIYYLNASQGGKYPGRFNNGIWGWSHDVQNWNFYFHWNQQQLCWPLNAAGFHELVEPYLNFRFNSLPLAKAAAKEYFNSDGAFISDVTDRRGYNSSGEKINHTPIAEIALDFWRQYLYTGDKKLLEENALPFMVEASRFYQSLFEKENDGLYHAKEGSGYEGWIKLKDGLTELVYAKALFSGVSKALKISGTKIPEATKWEDIHNHLAPFPTVAAGENGIAADNSGFKLKTGFFKGNNCPTDQIFAAGWGIKEKKMLTVYDPVADSTVNNGLKLLDGIFPSVPSSPVFPSGQIGLSQKGSELYRTMTATTLLYGSEITGWDPVPVVLARLGLAKELEADLKRFPGRWQIYCNGWGHWGMENEINKDAEWFFRTNQVKDVESTEKLPLRMWPFRHMSMESMSVLTTAMNESLLQSYDDAIRVFPAFPVNRNGRFTLHAQGGFVVSSEIKKGEVQWIGIKSLLGNPCKLDLPWEQAVVKSDQKRAVQKISRENAEIKTKVNEVIMILPQGQDPQSWTVVLEKPLANEKVKKHLSGKTQLGIERMF